MFCNFTKALLEKVICIELCVFEIIFFLFYSYIIFQVTQLKFFNMLSCLFYLLFIFVFQEFTDSDEDTTSETI
jgi:hypothetical protein